MKQEHSPPSTTGSLERPVSRRSWLVGMFGISVAASLPAGCALHRRRLKAKQGENGAPCSGEENQVPRRFFVSPQGPVGVDAVAGGFSRELVAAINTVPGCSAMLLPVDFPIDAPPDMPPGPSTQLLQFVESAGPSVAVDELLIVHVTEVIAFRPMRISAILERRSLSEGLVIYREHRTWQGPLDDQPLSPNPLNRLILNHPPPLDNVENHELSRISPLTFQRNVTKELAYELAASPI